MTYRSILINHLNFTIFFGCWILVLRELVLVRAETSWHLKIAIRFLILTWWSFQLVIIYVLRIVDAGTLVHECFVPFLQYITIDVSIKFILFFVTGLLRRLLVFWKILTTLWWLLWRLILSTVLRGRLSWSFGRILRWLFDRLLR